MTQITTETRIEYEAEQLKLKRNTIVTWIHVHS
jgi:hypothetical protein